LLPTNPQTANMNFTGLGGNLANKFTGNNANVNPDPANQNEDKVDTMLDKVEAKLAGQHGMPNPSGSLRGVNEKITDAAREAVEKATGKKIPANISN